MEEDRRRRKTGLFFGARVLRLLVRALRSWPRRIGLITFILLMALSVFLDTIDHPAWDLVGTIGFGGLATYLGFLLLKEVPSEDDEDSLYRLIGILWVFAGIVVILTFVLPSIF